MSEVEGVVAGVGIKGTHRGAPRGVCWDNIRPGTLRQ